MRIKYEVVEDNINFISNLDDLFWDWIYQAGDVIPRQIEGILVGLKMAAEQLQPVGETK